MVAQRIEGDGHFVVVGHYGATVAIGAEVLPGVEAESGGQTPAADRSAMPACPVGLCRVLDDRQPASCRSGRHSLHGGDLTVQVHRQYRPGPRRTGLGDQVGVDEEVKRIAVDQPDACSGTCDGLGRSNERIGRHHDLVTRPHTRGPKGELERVGPVGDTQRVGAAAIAGPGRLEHGDVGPVDEGTCIHDATQALLHLVLDLRVL